MAELGLFFWVFGLVYLMTFAMHAEGLKHTVKEINEGTVYDADPNTPGNQAPMANGGFNGGQAGGFNGGFNGGQAGGFGNTLTPIAPTGFGAGMPGVGAQPLEQKSSAVEGMTVSGIIIGVCAVLLVITALVIAF